MSNVAFITGAASGIGLALAGRLGAQGVAVTMADLKGEAVRAACASLRREGCEVEAVEVDVTDRAAFSRAISECASSHGRLDYLFNNAGVGMAAEVRDMRPEHWRRVIDVNLFGVIHGIDAAYPLMVAQGFGHIVNVASVAGLVPLPGESAYVASKYAVVGLSHTLRVEAAALGVQVNTVCPGVVQTPIYDTSPVIGFAKDKVLSLFPRGISPESCAEQILEGVARNRATIPITPTAHMLWRFHRLSPGLFMRAAEIYIRRMRRERTF